MSDQVKDNCIKLVSLINKLDSCQNKLSKSRENVREPTFFAGLAGVGKGMEAMAKARGDFCNHWNEGDNLVIIEKNKNNYRITLNPQEILFKVDNYTLDFRETAIDFLKNGPWIARFEKYVENRIKEVDSIIETEERMQHDSKFGEVDF